MLQAERAADSEEIPTHSARAKILLLAEEGVILAVKLVQSVKLVEFIADLVPVEAWTTCRTDPLALAAKVSRSTIQSGKPPTERPVTVPLPLIVTVIIYTIVQVSPSPTVTVTELFIVTGPKVPAL